MAQRARRRNSEPRKAPDWVPDELLDRLGVLLRDETFPKQARKVGRYWPERLDVLLDHAGGSVPPAELLEPIDELEERYGLPRVALTMLRVGIPSPLASGVIDRFMATNGLAPIPVDADADAVVTRPAVSASPETLLKERDRIAEDLRRERERTKDKDRKLREEREAHAATRSELTSERDKLRNALRETEKQLASGPSSEVITAALEALQRGRGRRRGGPPGPPARPRPVPSRPRPPPGAPSRRSRPPGPTSTPPAPRPSACAPRRRRRPTSCAPPATWEPLRCCGSSRQLPATPSCSR